MGKIGINKKETAEGKLIQHTQNLSFEFMRDHEISSAGIFIRCQKFFRIRK